MKIYKIMVGVLSLSVVVLIIIVVKMSRDSASEVVCSIQTNEVIDNIFSRKSVRAYTDQKVTRTQLDTLARVGMAAPTGMGREPWMFVLIDDRAILDSLAAELPNAAYLSRSTAAIAVCGNTEKAMMDVHENYWIQDCAAASENILLAAESMGLGAVWTGVWPRADRLESVNRILELPENIIPLNIIIIGYPAGENQPKDKFKPENIRWNNFQQ